MATKPHIILGTNMVGGRFKAPEVKTCLDDFAKHGHTMVDTAAVYTGGRSEMVLGDLGVSGKFQVHSKCWPIKPGDHSAEKLRATVEKSLQSLKTDSIDLYYLHAPDRATPILETLQTMDEFYRAGKVKALGLSNFTSYEVMKAYMTAEQHGLLKPTVYQGIYNPIHRVVEKELLPCLANLNMTFYAYSPLAGGLLSGNYARLEDPLPKTSRFNAKDWFDRYFNQQTFEGLNVVRDACKADGISMGEAALRWMVHHSALRPEDGLILGGSSLTQFQNNMDWCDKGPLPADIVAAFDGAYAASRATESPYFQPLPKKGSRL
ncbi:NADP-dependent oxidoreductase domain-containing protein [Hyaloraphidium curvatum]|nr:NADP-dependent oxidoreductase domain-containing protein [Hyaloraphidium curvatum]